MFSRWPKFARSLHRKTPYIVTAKQINEDGTVTIQANGTEFTAKRATPLPIETGDSVVVTCKASGNEVVGVSRTTPLEQKLTEAGATSGLHTGGVIVTGRVTLVPQTTPNLTIKQTGVAAGYAGTLFAVSPDDSIAVPKPGQLQTLSPIYLFDATQVQLPHLFAAGSLSLTLDGVTKASGVDYNADPVTGIITVLGESWNGPLVATLTPTGTACAGVYADNQTGELHAELVSTLFPTMPIRDIAGKTQVGWIENLTAETTAITAEMIKVVPDKQTLTKLLYGKGITDQSIADQFRQISYASEPAPSTGTLAALYDGDDTTTVALQANTTVTYKVALEETYNALFMDALEVERRFYVQAEDMHTGVWSDVLGTAATPILTVAGRYAHKISPVAKGRRMRVVFLDGVSLRGLKPHTVLYAENVYASQVIAGIGGGTVLDENGINVRDSNGKTIMKAGNYEHPDGTTGPLFALYDERGQAVFTPSGVLRFGEDGSSTDLLLRREQLLTPNRNYVVSGCLLGTTSRKVIRAEADARIYDGSNFGAESVARIFMDWESFLAVKIPISGIVPPVTRAWLYVWVQYASAGAGKLYAHDIAGSWFENSITKDNAPASGGFISPLSSTPSSGFTCGVDVLPVVQGMVAGTIPNNGFYIKSGAAPSGAYVDVRTKEYAPDMAPWLVIDDSDTASKVPISEGWVDIQGRLFYFPGGSFPIMTIDETAYVFLAYSDGIWNARKSTSYSLEENEVCLGRITRTGGLLTNPVMAPYAYRITGFYDRERFWGNRCVQFGPITVSKSQYGPNIFHGLRTLYPSVTLFQRQVGGTSWYPAHAIDTSAYQRGITWRTSGDNQICIITGQESAFYAFDNDGTALFADSAEIKGFIKDEGFL